MTDNVKYISFSALFLALGIIFPMLFHSIPNAGGIFLPMHIPVLLCGFICGPVYGLLIGILTPLLSGILTGMPPLMPIGMAMMLELATYGFLSGWLLKRFHISVSLILAMIAGRIVSGLANLVLLSFAGKAYTLGIFLGASFVTSLPGIILQLIIVPLFVQIALKIKKHPVT